MRVLIATVGGRGDVAPFTGLGTAMRAAGHSVTIATADMFQHGMGLQLQPMTPTREFPPSLVAARSLGRLGNRAAGRAAAATMALGLAGPAREIRRELGLPPRSAREALLGQPDARRWPVFHGFSPAVVPRPADWPDSYQVTGYWWPAPGSRLESAGRPGEVPGLGPTASVLRVREPDARRHRPDCGNGSRCRSRIGDPAPGQGLTNVGRRVRPRDDCARLHPGRQGQAAADRQHGGEPRAV